MHDDVVIICIFVFVIGSPAGNYHIEAEFVLFEVSAILCLLTIKALKVYNIFGRITSTF